MSNDPGFPNQFDAGTNPYQPVGLGQTSSFEGGQPGTAQLASLLQRFLGALIDAIFPNLFVIPGVILMWIGMFIMAQQADTNSGRADLSIFIFIGFIMIAIGFVITLGVQIFLLIQRSQTLGKYVIKSQIVDFETGQPADFVKSFVLRGIVNSVICSIPCVGPIYSLVDIFFIFRDDRRCVHDLLAGTTVIDISDR